MCYEAPIHDMIWIQYDIDRTIRKIFKIQDTIRSGYFNKKLNFKLKIYAKYINISNIDN